MIAFFAILSIATIASAQLSFKDDVAQARQQYRAVVGQQPLFAAQKQVFAQQPYGPQQYAAVRGQFGGVYGGYAVPRPFAEQYNAPSFQYTFLKGADLLNQGVGKEALFGQQVVSPFGQQVVSPFGQQVVSPYAVGKQFVAQQPFVGALGRQAVVPAFQKQVVGDLLAD